MELNGLLRARRDSEEQRDVTRRVVGEKERSESRELRFLRGRKRKREKEREGEKERERRKGKREEEKDRKREGGEREGHGRYTEEKSKRKTIKV